MEQPQHGYLERAHAISLLVFARKAGLGSEAEKIFTACSATDGTSFVDWHRAQDELQKMLDKRSLSNISHCVFRPN